MVSNLNKWMVREYATLLQDKEGVVVLGLAALDSEESLALRNDIRSAGAELILTKKRLAKTALAEVGVEIPADSWNGSCAFLVGDVDATLAAAKAIEKAWKKADERKVIFQGAFLDGSPMDSAAAAQIPNMADKDTLRAQICGAISGPARAIAMLLKEVPASTARVVQARADQGDNA
ncbi:MAG: 50S ribosomal protein L10 [Planctomycetes bacterium]|jgi:large subunit ribosomal protein L10|nr:50S ribosomal protein L10 [Planctomycetota bacterium]MBT4560957.1 50S ribosomal protein L10 [Planctomycetota bacterium]MBT7012066.1 50S ribosomal protein L10 [Planctomycetota bacterium]MBT7319303.1 50S ribosomal protein L10 [Planctomycetota bacterium]